jgi:Phage capsid family
VLSFATGPFLQPRKLSTTAIFTRELAEHSAIVSVVQRVIGQALALSLDTAIFSADAGTALKPAGILQTGAIAATANGGVAALSKDVSNLIAALVAAGGGADPVFICNPATRAKLFLWVPTFPYPVLQSGAVAADSLIALESSAFVSGFTNGTGPDISVTDQATFVMQDDDPVPDITSASVAAGGVRSLWQDDLLGLRFAVRGGWVLRAPALCQLVSSVTW